MTLGCGHGHQTGQLVREVLNALAPEACLEALMVQDEADAEHRRFPGSPTVRINGVDFDPEAPAGVSVG